MKAAFVYHKEASNPQFPQFLSGGWKIVCNIGISENDALRIVYASDTPLTTASRLWQETHPEHPFYWDEFEYQGKTVSFVADTKGIDRGYPCLRFLVCVYDTSRDEAQAWWDENIAHLEMFS